MSNLLHAFRKFGRRECGVTAIEYALLASLIAVTMTAGLALTGTRLDGLFSSIADTVSDPATNAGKGNGRGNGSGNGNSGGKGNGGPGSGVGGGGS